MKLLIIKILFKIEYIFLDLGDFCNKMRSKSVGLRWKLGEKWGIK